MDGTLASAPGILTVDTTLVAVADEKPDIPGFMYTFVATPTLVATMSFSLSSFTLSIAIDRVSSASPSAPMGWPSIAAKSVLNSVIAPEWGMWYSLLGCPAFATATTRPCASRWSTTMARESSSALSVPTRTGTTELKSPSPGLMYSLLGDPLFAMIRSGWLSWWFTFATVTARVSSAAASESTRPIVVGSPMVIVKVSLSTADTRYTWLGESLLMTMKSTFPSRFMSAT
mmetsp:Transcript_49479/g.111251  ORF Transcript_49479/g.111251 Transcript_49479/m.111251 type:complete len:230 (+) Transcript_49479:2791-3480(+)